MKRFLYGIIASFVFTGTIQAECTPPISCDPSILYAMGKQRTALQNRLGDYKNTIRQTRKSMEKLNKVCTLEAYELLRLKQRKRIESQKQMEINHIGNTLKSQTGTITQ